MMKFKTYNYKWDHLEHRLSSKSKYLKNEKAFKQELVRNV